jgi:hypothetical protein
MCPRQSIHVCWVEAVRRLVTTTGAELKLLILEPETPTRSSSSAKLRKSLTFRGNLWHLHNRFFPIGALPAHRQVPLTELGDVPQRVCPTTLKGKWSQHFQAEDIDFIRSLNLDFILRFAYGIIRGEILASARHGVWSFHHDDEQCFRGGPPAFWEIAKGASLQAAILQRLTERLDGGVILDKVWVPTDGLGYRRNLARIINASLDMPARAARALALGQTERVTAESTGTSAPIFVAPTDREMLVFGARVAANYLRYKWENQMFERWNIGVVRAPIHRFLDPDFRPEVEWAPYHRDGYMLADPFGVSAGDGLRVLCEEFSFFSERGWISELSWNRRAGWGEPRTMLDEQVHMSYPYPVLHEGGVYCMPECGARNRLALYRVDAERLVLERTMLEGPRLLDSTIFEHGGRWWLFGTRADEEPNAKLHIFHGPSAVGPWTPHPGNPVKTDVRCSRPAGTPFVHDGRLYRPAQDCTKRYGWRLAINHVSRLTPNQFEETPLRWIGPLSESPYPHGFHTLAACGDLTLVDAKWSGLNWPLLRFRLARKLGGRRPPPDWQ